MVKLKGGCLMPKSRGCKEELKIVLGILSTLHASDQSIFSNITKCENDDFDNKKTSIKNLSDLSNNLKQYIQKGNNLTATIGKKIQEFETYPDNRIPNTYIDWFNSNLGYLHHQIKAEKPYYTEQIEPYDLGKIWAVNAKLDNQRITNQSGAFLIFGLGVSEVKDKNGIGQLAYTKEFYPTVPDEWIAGKVTIGSEGDENPSRSQIKDQKEKIVSDLSMLGIQRSFIFPDLENVAKEINRNLLK